MSLPFTPEQFFGGFAAVPSKLCLSRLRSVGRGRPYVVPFAGVRLRRTFHEPFRRISWAAAVYEGPLIHVVSILFIDRQAVSRTVPGRSLPNVDRDGPVCWPSCAMNVGFETCTR